MFNSLLRFELAYRLKRPATYIFFFVFFLMAFLATSTDVVQVGGAAGKVNINAPFVTYTFVVILSVFAVFVASAIMGVPVYRDLEHKTGSYLFAYPMTEKSYLLARFLGSFVALVLVMTGVAVGQILGSLMPWVEQDQVGPAIFSAFVHSYLQFMIPNLLIMGFIFFSLVTLTRKIVAAYTGSAVLFVVYLISSAITSDLDNRTLSALLDPFGLNTFTEVTRYWTVAEKNSQILPYSGILLVNRAIWLGLSMLLFLFTLQKFRFSSLLFGKSKKQILAEEAPDTDLKIQIPKAALNFSAGSRIKQMWSMAFLDFRNITRDLLFISMLLAAIIFLCLDNWYQDQFYGTNTFPVTYLMMATGNFTYGLLTYAILIFFTAELVWKERSIGLSQITDALPVPNWFFLGSKFLSITLLSLLLSLVVMVGGIFTQAIKGYYNFEIGLYLRELLLIYFPYLLIFASFSFFVQTLANNKFVGIFGVIIFWIAIGLLPEINLNHPLYRFGYTPNYIYSDMNGYGHFIEGLLTYYLYWGVFSVILLILANLFWVRGIGAGFKDKLKLAKQRLGVSTKISLGVLIVLFVSIGGWIFYNTNVLHTYRTPKASRALQAQYEKDFKKYQGKPQPRIVSIKVQGDLYPSDLRARFTGSYILQNKHEVAIDSLIILLDRSLKNPVISYRGAAQEPIFGERENYLHIYIVDPPLQPGEEMGLDFTFELFRKGLPPSGESTDIVYNGTFLNSSIFPSFGYSPQLELFSDKYRKKNGLSEKERVADLDDMDARMNTYINLDSDWIEFEVTLSTETNQIAIAPGYLQREWEENGRRYFHYKMDSKILNFSSFMSARYEVHRDKWKDVNIEIYYHKGHEYNLSRMTHAIQKSLDYFTENFSPYQHRQARIIEFPRYGSFAQAFANTIPYSESIGFIAKVKDTVDDIDYPFFVTAHEIAHQWWAHQVIGGAVQGSTMLSESLAEYSALLVLEKEYGEEQMRKFLKYEQDKYLAGRAGESKKEMPLYRVENQAYIHYYKGSVVFYALKDYLGEAVVNKALRDFIDSVAFQEPPFTHSRDLLAQIKKVTPDSLNYLIEDMFEKITLYENRALTGNYKKLEDGKYEVELKFSTKKFYADSLGNEIVAPMNDWIDVGVIAEVTENGREKEKILFLEKQRLKEGEHSLKIIVDELPSKAGVDPMNKLIDRNPNDNRISLSNG
jgi:ABC-2 type transport system permease protein